MDQRLAFQKELRALEDKRLAEELAERRVRSQVAFASTGQNLQAQINRHLRPDPARPGTPVPLKDPKALRSLAGALRSAQQVVEVAFGKPADGEGSVHVDWTLFITPPPAAARQVLPDIDADGPEFGGVVTPPRGA